MKKPCTICPDYRSQASLTPRNAPGQSGSGPESKAIEHPARTNVQKSPTFAGQMQKGTQMHRESGFSTMSKNSGTMSITYLQCTALGVANIIPRLGRITPQVE